MTNLIKFGFILLFSSIFFNLTTVSVKASEISQSDFPIQEKLQLNIEQR